LLFIDSSISSSCRQHHTSHEKDQLFAFPHTNIALRSVFICLSHFLELLKVRPIH